MVDILVTVLSVAAGCGLVVALVYALEWRAQAKRALLSPDVRRVAETVAAPAPPPAPPPRPAPETVVARFVDGKGRYLGETQVLRKYRRPTYQWRKPNRKLGNFVATADAGRVVTYREVGTDREA